MTAYRPIFVTRQALRIAAVRRLLADAGVTADLQTVYPEHIEPIVTGAADWLVIVDGQAMPQPDVFGRMRQRSPGSRIVIWTDALGASLLLVTIECGLDGLLSSSLPPSEAAHALRRICGGERLLRFDAEAGEKKTSGSNRLAAAPEFDAQWMLHGAEPPGRETEKDHDADVAQGDCGRHLRSE